LRVLEPRIERGDLALWAAAEELGATVVEGAPEELRNVNTPADLEA
jgi:molybdopterin-guanine dinucleotide biosynthesis protein A